MSIEFVSLRLLAALQSPQDRDALREGAALASVPCEIVEATNAVEAKQCFACADTDIVLLDTQIPDPDKAQIAKAARAATGRPFIVLVGKDDGVVDADATLESPVQVSRATSVLECYARVKLPARAMIVDDSPTMRGIVKKILAGSRFPLDVVEVDDGSKAVAAISAEPVDIVFLDYNMPGLNGRETLHALKKISPDLAVVMMTSTFDEALKTQLLAEGAVALLKKPFYPADIDAAMHRSRGIEPLVRKP
jgi:CheY-like chemotaxis protein